MINNGLANPQCRQTIEHCASYSQSCTCYTCYTLSTDTQRRVSSNFPAGILNLNLKWKRLKVSKLDRNIAKYRGKKSAYVVKRCLEEGDLGLPDLQRSTILETLNMFCETLTA